MKLPESTQSSSMHLNYFVYANEAISWPKDMVRKVKEKPDYIDILFENRFADLSGFFGKHGKIHRNFVENLEDLNMEILSKEIFLMI